MPPPWLLAELPLTVLLVSVAVLALMPPPAPPAWLPLTVLLVSVAVARPQMPPPVGCGVAADGAVGQGRRAGADAAAAVRRPSCR